MIILRNYELILKIKLIFNHHYKWCKGDFQTSSHIFVHLKGHVWLYLPLL